MLAASAAVMVCSSVLAGRRGFAAADEGYVVMMGCRARRRRAGLGSSFLAGWRCGSSRRCANRAGAAARAARCAVIAFSKTVAQGFSPAEAAALKGCATTEKRKAR